jgi:putative ABC transport system substrate-binding protein
MNIGGAQASHQIGCDDGRGSAPARALGRFTLAAVLLITSNLLAACIIPASGSSSAPHLSRIGYLSSGEAGIPDDSGPYFIGGLHALGYVQGQNILVEHRYAQGRLDEVPRLINELLTLPVDLVVLGDTRVIGPARQATQSVPLVMLFSTDPVESGLIESLARPGGNLTGVSSMTAILIGKQLQLLLEIKPGSSMVAVVYNPAQLTGPRQWREATTAAARLGINVHPVPVQSIQDLEDAARALALEPPDAMLVLGDALFNGHVQQTVEMGLASRVPTMYTSRTFVDFGGLAAYTPDRPEMYRRGAYFVDRILKGASPATLPVEQPTKFEFVINLQTARSLGLTVPNALLLDATAVVQ